MGVAAGIGLALAGLSTIGSAVAAYNQAEAQNSAARYGNFHVPDWRRADSSAGIDSWRKGRSRPTGSAEAFSASAFARAVSPVRAARNAARVCATIDFGARA